MSVRIVRNVCNGCGTLTEPRCAVVCPGDLLYRDALGKCAVRDPNDCWDCAACVKECPREAIELYLPIQIGGRGSTLTAKTAAGKITWILKNADGLAETFEIVTQNY